MQKRILALLLAVFLVAALAACGNGGGAQAPTPTPQGPVTVEVEAEGASGRTDLNLVIPSVLGSADPHADNSINARLLLWNVFESLIHADDRGNVEMRLAERYELADDNRTYTFHLRRDVLFHNGDPLRASDVVFSLDRAQEAPLMYRFIALVESYRAIDDYTVEIVSRNPMAMFLFNLSNIRITNERAFREAGDQAFLSAETSLSGTGPFYFTEFDPSTYIRMAAFPYYYRGMAAIHTVNYRHVIDTATALIGFQAGEFDFVAVPFANVEEIIATGRHNVHMHPTAHASFTRLNINQYPTNNRLVRQAIAYAINNEEVLLGSLSGWGDVAENLARENFIFGATTEGVPLFHHNPERARELLVEAGYPDGVDIGSIVAIAGLYFARAAEIIQQQLGDVGITVQVEALEQSLVVDRTFFAQTFNMAFHGDNLLVDSDNVYRIFFDPNAVTTMPNHNPRIAELGELAGTTLDPEERIEIYREFWQIVQYEAAILAIFHRYNPFATDPNLNVVLDTMFYWLYDWSWQ